MQASPTQPTVPMADDEVMALVRLLCRYLRENPMACDTPDGIARWWLATASGETPVRGDSLQRALDWLETRGLVERLRAADGRVRYRRVPGDVDFDVRVRRALDGASNGPPPAAADASGGNGHRVH